MPKLRLKPIENQYWIFRIKSDGGLNECTHPVQLLISKNFLFYVSIIASQPKSTG